MPARVYQTCKLADCDRPHYGNGMCHLHYQRMYRTGTTAQRIRSRGVCRIAGCGRTVKGRGLCEAHYMRWYSGSTNDGPIRPVAGTGPHHGLPSTRSRSEWLQYAAGFFDGEGCISIVRSSEKHRRYWLQAAASQINPRPLEIFQALFGGRIKVMTRTSKALTGRACLQWSATCRQAQLVLEELRPFLVVKQPEADVALAFQKTMHRQTRIVTDDVLAERERLCREITRLKNVSHPFTPPG